MSNQDELCECGCWGSRHKEEWNEETHESFWPCNRCKDCDDYRPDPAATREAKNEYLVLQDDIRRGK